MQVAGAELSQRVGVVAGEGVEPVVGVIRHEELFIRQDNCVGGVVALGVDELTDLGVVGGGIAGVAVRALTVAVGIGIGVVQGGHVRRRDLLGIVDTAKAHDDGEYQGYAPARGLGEARRVERGKAHEADVGQREDAGSGKEHRDDQFEAEAQQRAAGEGHDHRSQDPQVGADDRGAH